MIRVGTGYDLHTLGPSRPLVLGGVTIPYERGLVGHSDADVLSHAITDALLGACAMGNIGRLFPDTDPRYKDADSLVLLARVNGMLAEAGYRIGNIDATIVAQAPKLDPHLDSIRAKLAYCLHIDISQISVKAKTNERVGPEGRGEAISAQAVALVEHDSPR